MDFSEFESLLVVLLDHLQLLRRQVSEVLRGVSGPDLVFINRSRRLGEVRFGIRCRIRVPFTVSTTSRRPPRAADIVFLIYLNVYSLSPLPSEVHA